MKTIITVLSLLTLGFSSLAFGDEKVQFNIVNLRAEQTRQVANDVMVVIMQAATQKNSSAEAASSVNETMAWADPIISTDAAIEHRTMNYQTRPVYQNKQIIGWSASQQLELRSSDIDSLTTMAGSLQQRLQIVAMRFEISPEKRAKEMESLIVEGLNAFQARAELITQTMAAKDYRIVNISVDDNGGRVPYRAMVQAESMAARAPAPRVEAGDSQIQISVGGAIQLIF